MRSVAWVALPDAQLLECHGGCRMNAQAFWLRELGRATAYNDWVMDAIGELVGEQVLELGCGTGTFSALLSQRGYNVTAIDIDEEFVRSARMANVDNPSVSFVVADLCRMPVNKKYDTAIMLDVLEHLEHDIQVLRDLRRILRPAGMLVVKVPATPRLFGTLDEAVGHYRRYTKDSLTNALSSAGFSRIRIDAINALSIPGWWFNGIVRKRPHPPATQVELFSKLVPLARWIDQCFGNRIGLSLVARAYT